MSSSSAAAKAHDAAFPDVNLEAARRYADALLGAAENEGQVEPVLAEFAEIESDVLDKFPAFDAILASPRVPANEKDRMLVEIFEGRSSSLALRFLRVLNRHGRLDLLRVILREARDMGPARGRVPVRVRSAVPLEANQVESLKSGLAKLLAATPILHIATDPRLIGGLIIEVGDDRYDLSVKSRLEQVRQRLLEGKTHEIQSRRDQFSHSA